MKILAQIPLLLFVLITYCAVALLSPEWLNIQKSKPAAVEQEAVTETPAEAVTETPTDTETAVDTVFAPVEVKPVFLVQLVSGAAWGLTFGEILITIALLLLFIEIFKGTRANTASILDHLLSTFVLILYIVLFLIWNRAGTGIFFILTCITLIDVLCGFTVSITSARRDVSFS